MRSCVYAAYDWPIVKILSLALDKLSRKSVCDVFTEEQAARAGSESQPSASEEPFAEGRRDKLLIIKKINSSSMCNSSADRLRARHTKKERYIERAKGPSEWT